MNSDTVLSLANGINKSTSPDYLKSIEFAHDLDSQDTLKSFREQFHMPKHTDEEGKTHEALYFCGNSLGLQPKLTQEFLTEGMLFLS